MRDLVQERKVVWGKNKLEDESAVVAKIAKFPEPDRSLATRLHSMVKATAPELSSRLWYGMPAYTKNGDVVCFFQPAHKFKARYATFGFTPKANLDEGEVWATYFSFKRLTDEGATRLAALVKKAVS